MQSFSAALWGLSLGCLLTWAWLRRRWGAAAPGPRAPSQASSAHVTLPPWAPELETELEEAMHALEALQVRVQASVVVPAAPGSVADDAELIKAQERVAQLGETIEHLDHFSTQAQSTQELVRANLMKISGATHGVEGRLGAIAPLFNEGALLSTAVTAHLQALIDASRTYAARGVAFEGEWQSGSTMVAQFEEALSALQRDLTQVEDAANKARLLSLNASIVASQAKEQGRGFQVVAEQIKRMAAHTRESSRRMGQSLQSVGRFKGQFVQLGQQLAQALASSKDDHQEVQNQATLAQSTNTSLRQLLELRGETLRNDEAMAQMTDAVASLVQGLMDWGAALRAHGRDSRRAQALTQELAAEISRMRGQREPPRAEPEGQGPPEDCAEWERMQAALGAVRATYAAWRAAHPEAERLP